MLWCLSDANLQLLDMLQNSLSWTSGSMGTLYHPLEVFSCLYSYVADTIRSSPVLQSLRDPWQPQRQVQQRQLPTSALQGPRHLLTYELGFLVPAG